MISSANEIEIKFDGSKVDLDEFKKFCYSKNPYRFIEVTGTDTYYQNESGHVARHRVDNDAPHRHELTSKLRKSESSTRDRQEIDLKFYDGITTPEEVSGILEMLGFKSVFSIIKTAHIFWFEKGKHEASVVIYDVSKIEDGKLSEPKRFIEAEIEKGSDITTDTAKRNLQTWVDEIQTKFKVGEPLNDSLWEIFSGQRYKLVNQEGVKND